MFNVAGNSEVAAGLVDQLDAIGGPRERDTRLLRRPVSPLLEAAGYPSPAALAARSLSPLRTVQRWRQQGFVRHQGQPACDRLRLPPRQHWPNWHITLSQH